MSDVNVHIPRPMPLCYVTLPYEIRYDKMLYCDKLKIVSTTTKTELYAIRRVIN